MEPNEARLNGSYLWHAWGRTEIQKGFVGQPLRL